MDDRQPGWRAAYLSPNCRNAKVQLKRLAGEVSVARIRSSSPAHGFLFQHSTRASMHRRGINSAWKRVSLMTQTAVRGTLPKPDGDIICAPELQGKVRRERSNDENERFHANLQNENCGGSGNRGGRTPGVRRDGGARAAVFAVARRGRPESAGFCASLGGRWHRQSFTVRRA